MCVRDTETNAVARTPACVSCTRAGSRACGAVPSVQHNLLTRALTGGGRARACIAAMRPCFAAWCSGVRALPSRGSTSAPSASRRSTVLACPSLAATCSGVSCFASRASTWRTQRPTLQRGRGARATLQRRPGGGRRHDTGGAGPGAAMSCHAGARRRLARGAARVQAARPARQAASCSHCVQRPVRLCGSGPQQAAQPTPAALAGADPQVAQAGLGLGAPCSPGGARAGRACRPSPARPRRARACGRRCCAPRPGSRARRARAPPRRGSRRPRSTAACSRRGRAPPGRSPAAATQD